MSDSVVQVRIAADTGDLETGMQRAAESVRQFAAVLRTAGQVSGGTVSRQAIADQLAAYRSAVQTESALDRRQAADRAQAAEAWSAGQARLSRLARQQALDQLDIEVATGRLAADRKYAVAAALESRLAALRRAGLAAELAGQQAGTRAAIAAYLRIEEADAEHGAQLTRLARQQAERVAQAWQQANERIAGQIVDALARKGGGIKAVLHSLVEDALRDLGRGAVTGLLGRVEGATGLSKTAPSSLLGSLFGPGEQSAGDTAKLAGAALTTATTANTVATAANTTATATAGEAGAAGGGGGVFGALGGALSWLTGLLGFAEGGSPPVGRPSIVGERGPELFVPQVAGTVIPAGGWTIGASADLASRSAALVSSVQTSQVTGDQHFAVNQENHFHGGYQEAAPQLSRSAARALARRMGVR